MLTGALKDRFGSTSAGTFWKAAGELAIALTRLTVSHVRRHGPDEFGLSSCTAGETRRLRRKLNRAQVRSSAQRVRPLR
jgi:hypothetical protein